MSEYAPARDDGMKPYVVTKRSVRDRMDGRVRGRIEWATRIEWAEDLQDAKLHFGWTSEQHATVYVRRATPADMEPGA